MAQYIDKSALVAEIERLDEFYHHSKSAGGQAFIESLLSFINTIEVKDEDSFDATVCKIGSTYLKEMDKDAIIKALEPYKDGDKVKVIIKAQKGE